MKIAQITVEGFCSRRNLGAAGRGSFGFGPGSGEDPTPFFVSFGGRRRARTVWSSSSPCISATPPTRSSLRSSYTCPNTCLTRMPVQLCWRLHSLLDALFYTRVGAQTVLFFCGPAAASVYVQPPTHPDQPSATRFSCASLRPRGGIWALHLPSRTHLAD